MKICSRCLFTKPLDDFFHQKTSKDGHMPYCKKCSKTAHDIWMAENKDHANRQRKEYWDAHPIQKRAMQKRNYEKRKADPIKWAKQKKCVSAASSIWRKKNPQKTSDYKRRREALKRTQTPHDSTSVGITLHAVYQRDNGICSLCFKPVNKKLRWPNPLCGTIDHIISLANGGEHSWPNMALAHHICNSRKSNYVVTQQLRLF